MNPRQKKIFGTFLVLIMLTQCVAVIVSFPASADALRVWISPKLRLGSEAMMRAVVVGSDDLKHRKGVRYRVVLEQEGREQPLIEKNEETSALDLRFKVPRWVAGPARLLVTSSHEGTTQSVKIPVRLVTETSAGVRWSPVWRAMAGTSPMDAAEEEPKRAAKLPVQAFPRTGWAVRNIDLPLVVRRKSGKHLRVRREGDTGTGVLFDPAGYATLTMPQPLNRGRYRIQVATGTGSWTTHDLWLHNPPAELQITSPAQEIAPGQDVMVRLRSDSPRSSYTLHVYHGAQWQATVEVPMANRRGEIVLKAPQETCWLNIIWASDLVTDTRRRAYTTLRVGNAALPPDVPDHLAHPGSTLGRVALLSRIRPQRLQPMLRADTTALRKAQVLEQKSARQRWINLVFQLIITSFIAWLCFNLFAMQVSRTRSRKALALEMEEAEFLEGHEFQTLGTILVLLGLLCLLYVISYLFNHMVWGF